MGILSRLLGCVDDIRADRYKPNPSDPTKREARARLDCSAHEDPYFPCPPEVK